ARRANLRIARRYVESQIVAAAAVVTRLRTPFRDREPDQCQTGGQHCKEADQRKIHSAQIARAPRRRRWVRAHRYVSPKRVTPPLMRASGGRGNKKIWAV